MVEIDGSHLTLEDVDTIARSGGSAVLSEMGRQNIQQSYSTLEQLLQIESPVYGINTGFGIFATRRIPLEDSARLSRNLILSHSVGSGPDLPLDVVRAAMLVRANTLSKGFSGVRIELVQKLLDMINSGVVPIVPSQGSLGSSGDLVPLSHMALVLSTDDKDLDSESGWAVYGGQRMSGKAAMAAAGLARFKLGPKEGLALNNGATFSAAQGALSVIEAEYLLDLADASLALTLEALLGCKSAFDPRLHLARGLSGQMQSAAHVLQLLDGSTFMDAACRVQDAYSLRCAPQVHGAARDTVGFVRQILSAEINAATDNPLIFSPADAISGGNFHGEPVGMVLDYLGIAMAEIAAISERRTYRLTDEKSNGGLTPMLVDTPEDAGLNSGLMMPQYNAASLVLENQVLAVPDSVHSLPTSGGQEDHNANAWNAAMHARKILDNTAQVLAIEIYTAVRAIDLRMRQMPEARLGKGTQAVYQRVREAVPYQAGDAWWGPEIYAVRQLINDRALEVVSSHNKRFDVM